MGHKTLGIFEVVGPCDDCGHEKSCHDAKTAYSSGPCVFSDCSCLGWRDPQGFTSYELAFSWARKKYSKNDSVSWQIKMIEKWVEEK